MEALAESLLQRSPAVGRSQAERPAGRHHLPLAPAHEAARLVRLVELHRLDRLARRPEPALERLVVEPDDRRVGMHHEALADEARGVREPRELQEPRRPDAVRADDHDVGSLVVLAPRAIDVGGTARPAASVRRDAVHARPGDESHAALERLRPVREIGGGLRAIRAAREARAAQAARAQVPVRARGDRLRPGPPVPAEPVHARGRSPADLADRQRRERRARARGIGRIARRRRRPRSPAPPARSTARGRRR